METTSTRTRQGLTGCIQRHVKGRFCVGDGSLSPRKRVVAVGDNENESSYLSKNESSSKSSERKGGMSKGKQNLQLKVRWNDQHGKNLVHEFKSETRDKNEVDLCPCRCHIM